MMTLHTVGANEVVRDSNLLDTTLRMFELIEQSSTPYQVIFPWLPTFSLFKRFYAGTRMYMIFEKIVAERKRTGRRGEDALQYLLDEGDTPKQVVSVCITAILDDLRDTDPPLFVVGALLAAQLNTGLNSAWVLCYLAASPFWLSEVRKEIQSVVDKHLLGDKASLIDRLGKLSLEAWEQDFPIIDYCLRDSIRLQLHGAAFRRNITGKPITIGDRQVPPDGFLLYHFGEHHLNPEYYQQPEKWDPSRYFPDRAEDKKEKYAYIGWGAGRHREFGSKNTSHATTNNDV
jgi:sterol 14-demethylase